MLRCVRCSSVAGPNVVFGDPTVGGVDEAVGVPVAVEDVAGFSSGLLAVGGAGGVFVAYDGFADGDGSGVDDDDDGGDERGGADPVGCAVVGVEEGDGGADDDGDGERDEDVPGHGVPFVIWLSSKDSLRAANSRFDSRAAWSRAASDGGYFFSQGSFMRVHQQL